MFLKLSDFLKSYPAAKDLPPDQQEKAMNAFNASKKADPEMEDGEAFSSAMKTAKGKTEAMSDDNFFYVAVLSELDGAKSVIEVLKTGKVHDRDLTITKPMMEAYVKNFHEGVYGTEVQVNLKHDRNGEAAGWVKDLYVEGDRLLAEVEWTSLGVEKVSSKRYKFTSSELAASFPHVETGEPVKNVLIGVALTNIPAVKGLKAVTLSEQAQIYISNFETMNKFKELQAKLLAQKSVSAAEFTQLEEAAAAAVDAGEATAEEAATATAEVKEKVEAPAAPAAPAPAPAAPAAGEALSMEKLAERLDNLAEENTDLKKQVKELSEKNQLSASKIELNELSEDVKKTLCLSEGKKSTGFKPDGETVGRVAKFMQNLDEDQRKEFKELLAMHQTVDLSERGASAGTSPVSEDLSADLVKANTEAKKRHAADPSKELHQHLAEVTVEMGLAD